MIGLIARLLYNLSTKKVRRRDLASQLANFEKLGIKINSGVNIFEVIENHGGREVFEKTLIAYYIQYSVVG